MLCTIKFQRSFDEATLQQGYRKIRYVDPDQHLHLRLQPDADAGAGADAALGQGSGLRQR